VGVLLLLSLGEQAIAQSTTAIISGVVRDEQGAVLPGVTVTARNVDTSLTRTVVDRPDWRCTGSRPCPSGPTELSAEIDGVRHGTNGPAWCSR